MPHFMLPDGLLPEDFGSDARFYEGVLALAAMSRLSPLLANADDAGAEPVRLRFSAARDEAGRRILEGSIEAILPLICQRCLRCYQQPIETTFRLIVVSSEAEAEVLPAELEPYVSGSGTVRPLDVVEEELLLALPFPPRHPPGGCRPPAHSAGIERQQLSPFAELRERISGSASGGKKGR
ncbi:YceD family protein [Halorhodospira abdelmalekii]|uniref:YceD family protein n=1 Tax=Halorhodospira abdelmalekii TaxID=421629 RepID=UPI0019043D01|nr:YceD family protein [Halorhodospira abdelmalekii]